MDLFAYQLINSTDILNDRKDFGKYNELKKQATQVQNSRIPYYLVQIFLLIIFLRAVD